MKYDFILELRSLRNIFLRDILHFFRDKTRIIASVVQPIFFLGVFGVGLKSALGVGQGLGFDFVEFMFPGIIATTTLGVALNTSISIVTDREFGFLKEILVAPVSRASIVAGKIFSGIFIGLFQAIMLIALSPIFGLKIDWGAIPGLLFIALLLSFAVTSMGLLIASRMRSAEGFQFIFQFLFFPMMFLSGAFFPITDVPTWMKIISNINPLTYAVDGLRNIVFHGVPEIVRNTIIIHSLRFDALLIVAFGLIMFGLAFWSFNRAE
ncbi:MAG: ABC transporter [Candidatus Kerfeldbacteria bacterium CG_4_10_14_0_8_um_filter_42_10]|uniref:Transport permease protein n=1 Tax=Candidatus Kerfeldbacteria bacterium CG_4_10_14_0_8_um_filter_42_10 TaxID=2014248 RepID=A0A2M7RFV8_9BACT|nr:MAG: ABC transporter [Candidatus Kerfeldbacteria bacterium CG_4_10_14_0_8_um_filter_42_10]